MRDVKVVLIKNENQMALGWFFMLITLFEIVVIGLMLYGLFFDNHNGSRVLDYITILFFLTIGALITAHIGLWRVNGRDIISFYEHYLTVQSKGGIFHLKPKIFYFKSNLRVEEIEQDTLGIEKNRMVIKGIEGHRKFGHGLNKRKTNLWQEKLNSLIIERVKKM